MITTQILVFHRIIPFRESVLHSKILTKARTYIDICTILHIIAFHIGFIRHVNTCYHLDNIPVTYFEKNKETNFGRSLTKQLEESTSLFITSITVSSFLEIQLSNRKNNDNI